MGFIVKERVNGKFITDLVVVLESSIIQLAMISIMYSSLNYLLQLCKEIGILCWISKALCRLFTMSLLEIGFPEFENG